MARAGLIIGILSLLVLASGGFAMEQDQEHVIEKRGHSLPAPPETTFSSYPFPEVEENYAPLDEVPIFNKGKPVSVFDAMNPGKFTPVHKKQFQNQPNHFSAGTSLQQSVFVIMAVFGCIIVLL